MPPTTPQALFVSGALLEPEALQGWLAGLPLGKPLDAAALLADVLQQQNDSTLPPARRLELRLACRAAVHALLAALEKECAHRPQLNQPRRRNASRQAMRLGMAWFSGLARCVEEQEEARQGAASPQKQRQETVVLALGAARDALQAALLSYSPPPARFWLRSHALFRLAQKHGWSNRSAPGSGDATPIATLYRQLLLLGCSPCNALPPAALQRLFSLVRRQAYHLHMHESVTWPHGHHGFAVRTDADLPPAYISERPPQRSSLYCLLDTRELCSELTRLLRTEEGQGSELLPQLLQHWKQPARRRHQRLPVEENVEVVLSLPLCSKALQPADTSASGRRTTPSPARMRVLNVSDGGLVLQGETGRQPLHCGEVLLLHNSQPGWQLGMLRWVSLDADSKGCTLGVQLLGMGPQAVSWSESEDDWQPALRLPTLPGIRNAEQLLVAGQPFRRQRELQLDTPAGRHPIRLLQLVTQSTLYQLMEYRPG